MGTLDRKEFIRILRDPRTNRWLSAMEIEVGDANALFDLLDDGDGKITVDELVRGVSRLRGAARSIDVVTVMCQVSNMKQTFDEFASKNEFHPDESAVARAVPCSRASCSWSL